jgi:quercetin dioxygenase-like cupin family protein
MIIIPAGKPHALKAVTPYKMLLVMIRQDAPGTDAAIEAISAGERISCP